MPIETDKTYFTTAEVAELLMVTQARVGQLLKEGKLTGQMINPRLWLVDKESIKMYVESGSTYPRKIDRG